jgi:hypothetical protein
VTPAPATCPPYTQGGGLSPPDDRCQVVPGPCLPALCAPPWVSVLGLPTWAQAGEGAAVLSLPLRLPPPPSPAALYHRSSSAEKWRPTLPGPLGARGSG